MGQINISIKMKNLKYLLMAVLALLVAACSPDDYSLGDKNITSDDLVEGLAYTLTHDSSNPNIVYLKSLLPSSYTTLWDTPQGRSQEAEMTLKMPFAGDYQVRMGVETPGGVVYGPYTTLRLTTSVLSSSPIRCGRCWPVVWASRRNGSTTTVSMASQQVK